MTDTETVRLAEPATARPLRPRIGRRTAGILWAAVTVLIFSGWFVVTRFAVKRELGIWDVTALRFGIGAVILAPAVLRRGGRLPLAAWREGLVFALLWGVPFVLLVALGLQLTSAAEASSIAPTMMPVFVGLFGWAFLGERPGWMRRVGYLGIVAGVAGLIAAGADARGSTSVAGLAALAGASAMWAVYTLLFRRSGLTALQAGALICIWSAGLYLPVYLLLGLSRFGLASTGEIALQVVYQGILMSGVAIVTYNRAVSLLGAAAATAIIPLIPATASALAVPVLGETPSAAECAAIVVIVLGVLLASRPAAARAAPPAQQS